MMESLQKARVLNGNALKFLAAFCMVIDHIGFMFFPTNMSFRIVGRFSMPIFAFLLSEGCRYTKNRTKHFALLFALAAICQIVYYFFDNGNLYMSILITFSLSVLMIYAMQYLKKCIFDNQTKRTTTLLAFALFVLSVVGTFVFCKLFTIDYGFVGCLLPVFASVFDFRGIPAPDKLKKWDVLPVRVLCFTFGLVWHCFVYQTYLSVVWFCLLTVPLLLLYNGKKGKMKTKYFFYIFYPLHLAVLEGIFLLIH